MAFRTSEYLQRNELVRYQLDNVIRIPDAGQHQQKSGYKFTINDRSSFYDWYCRIRRRNSNNQSTQPMFIQHGDP